MNEPARTPETFPEGAPPPDAAPAVHPGAAVARNAMHLVFGQAALTLLSIGLSAVLGRSLGARDFGVYYFASATTFFAYTIVEWGQPQLLIQLVAREPESAGTLLGSAAVMRAVGAALGAGAAALATRAMGYDLRTQLLVALFMATWLPTSLAQAFGLAFRGRERMDSDAQVNVANKAFFVAIAIPVLALGGGLTSVALSLGAAGLGSLVVADALRRRLAFAPPRPSRRAIRQLLVEGAPIMLMNLVLVGETYVGTLFLSKFTPPEVIGWYGAARNIYGALVMPTTILVSASFPRFSRTSDDLPAFRREVAASLRPVLGAAVLGSIGTYLFAHVAIGVVFGRAKFGPAIVVLQLLAPTLFLISIDTLLGFVALAAGRAKWITAWKIVALVMTGVLAWVLVPWTQARFGNGAYGVVAALAAAELIMLASLARLVPRGVLTAAVFRDLLRAMAAGAVALAAVRLLPTDHPVVAIPVCILAFGGAAWAVRLIGAGDLAVLREGLRRRA